MTEDSAQVQPSGNCRNCGIQLAGPVCHECGQRHAVARWSAAAVWSQLAQKIFDLDRGILYTAFALFRRPGTVIRDYWSGRTVNYFDPARHLLLWLVLSILLSQSLGNDEIMQATLQPEGLEQAVGSDRLAAADRKFDGWMHLFLLLIVPVTAATSLLLFRQAGKNYGEHLILNTYSFGQQAILGFPTEIFLYFRPDQVTTYLLASFAVGWLYTTVLLRQTFAVSWLSSLWKAFVLSTVGVITFALLMALFSMLALATT